MLDYRNILRAASDPHKSMRTMELELLFPEEYQKTHFVCRVSVLQVNRPVGSTETVNWGEAQIEKPNNPNWQNKGR